MQVVQLLGHIGPKKLTHVIKFIEISLLCIELGLTSWFLTNILSTRCYHSFELVLVQTNHYPFFF
jgi:hypothetical protein